MSEPREFWIYAIPLRPYMVDDTPINGVNKEFEIHVIEYSALAEARAEIDKFQKLRSADCTYINQLCDERDQSQALAKKYREALEKIKAGPEVPIQKEYNSKLALAELVASFSQRIARAALDGGGE